MENELKNRLKFLDASTIEINLDVNEQSIALVEEIVNAICQQWKLTEKIRFSLNIVLEELVSNVVFYAFTDEIINRFINIVIGIKDQEIEITIVDNGKEFNPLKHTQKPVSKQIEEVSIGGLGIHLVKNFSSTIHYERENETNKIRVNIPY